MGRYCIRAKKGDKKSKDVKCACQEDGKVVTFKMKKNCGPPSTEVLDPSNKVSVPSTEVLAPSTKVLTPAQTTMPNGKSRKKLESSLSLKKPPTGDENLHAKLERLIRNDGYRSAAWILEASRLYIKGVEF